MLARSLQLGFAFVLAAGLSPVQAQTPLADPLPDIPQSTTTLLLTDAVSDLPFPTSVTDPGDGSGRIFVTGVDGRVHLVRAGGVATVPFADLRQNPPFGNNGSACSGLAFHPDFAADEAAGTGGRLYLIMTEAPGSGLADFGVPGGEAHQSVLYEMRPDPANPNAEGVASRREILRINENATIHNLDDLAFGPDGYLYLSKGDDLTGGQNTATIHGTILRIDVDMGAGNAPGANGQYAIPADNPFVGDASGLDEIYAYGFRNPWRITFDRLTGALYCADIGESDIEEINLVSLAPDGSARNYGWNEMEGPFRYLGSGVTDDLGGLPAGFDGVDPIGAYDHTENFKSISGGVLYRGTQLPQLVGHYICADWISGRLFDLDPATGRLERFPIDPGGDSIHGQPPYLGGQPPEGAIAVREDASGELLVVVTQRNMSPTGRIVRVEPGPCRFENRCALSTNSTGSAAMIGAVGSASLGANNLGLCAAPVPAGVPGLFFYGPNEIETPFGDGYRCAGGAVVRIPPVAQATAGGELCSTLDTNQLPHALLAPGMTRNFQAWFRDSAAGGSGFNLSDALRVTFCP